MESERTNDYFGDLSIRSAYDKSFGANFSHGRRNNCQPGIFSIEMILEGSVHLLKDKQFIELKSPVVFWLGDLDTFFQYAHIGSPYRHLWIDFSGSRGRRIYLALRSKYPQGKIAIPKKNLPAILQLFMEIDNDFHRSGGYNRNTMTFKMENLIYLILAVEDESRQVLGDPYDIGGFIENIRRNPFGKYDSGEAAASKGISEVYFRMLFRQSCGMPFTKFLYQTRLECSKQLILSGKLMIKEIADLCGFSCSNSFSNAFSASFGISPGKFRKQQFQSEDQNRNQKLE